MQGMAKVGLQLWVCKTQFILVLLFIIALFSKWTTVNLFLLNPVFGCSYVKWINVYKCYIFFSDWSLYHSVMSFLSLITVFVFISFFLNIYCYLRFSFSFGYMKYLFPFFLLICVCLSFWGEYLVDSIYIGLVFLSSQMPYVF